MIARAAASGTTPQGSIESALRAVTAPCNTIQSTVKIGAAHWTLVVAELAAVAHCLSQAGYAKYLALQFAGVWTRGGSCPPGVTGEEWRAICTGMNAARAAAHRLQQPDPGAARIAAAVRILAEGNGI